MVVRVKSESQHMNRRHRPESRVKPAVKILCREAGVHPQIAGEALDVAAYLTALLETERDALTDENLDEFNAAFGRFLEEGVEDDIEPAAIILGLWLQLRAVGHANKAEASRRKPDRGFA